jgi:DNA-binding NarL/FixJ family response regulator
MGGQAIERGRSSADSYSVRSTAMHAIVSWCEALGGAISLQAALTELAAGLGAEAGVIVRTQMNDNHPVRIAQCDLTHGVPVRPLQRSFADSYFGPLIYRARAATIWQARLHADDATGDPSLGEWQAARRMKEMVVLVLSSGPQTRDHIELHFREALSHDTETTLALMLPDMVRVWASRRVGLVTRSIINHRTTDAGGFHAGRKANVLGSDNPMRLSRAEFRVCLLLSNGLMLQAVARELALSEATVRSHLRNIYQKTACGSLAELVFKLIDGRSIPDTPRSLTA